MGRNAYFFGSGQIGQRSKHSLLADACVTCHLEKTPADPAAGVGLTTDGAGTNHSFGIITDPTLTVDAQVNALCQKCHGDFEGTGVQKTFTAAYNNLLAEIAEGDPQDQVRQHRGDSSRDDAGLHPGTFAGGFG